MSRQRRRSCALVGGLFFSAGQGLALPAANLVLVALAGAAHRPRRTPAQPHQDLPDVSGMVGDAELLFDQPPDALAGPPGSGVARRLGAVEQPLLPLRQVRGAELRLGSSAAGMAERLRAALRRLLRPAADALLRDAEAAERPTALLGVAQGYQLAVDETLPRWTAPSRSPLG